MLLVAIAAASAVTLDQAALSRVVASAAARVELVTGRALDRIPPLVLTDAPTMRDRERRAIANDLAARGTAAFAGRTRECRG